MSRPTPATDAPPAHPGVPFPPLLLFVAGFGAGMALERLVPRPALGLPSRLTFALAALLVLLGVLVLAWALRTFRRARTGIYPTTPASQIVSEGPYRFSRNPMYVGMSMLYVGLALWTSNGWALPLLPLVLWGVWRIVIQREERYLAAAFGEAYAEYTRRVRRWL